MAEASLGSVLEVRGVTKRFGAAEALRGVDLDVHAAEVVALVGDNGAGKSTLVKILSGIFPQDGGTLRFDGREVHLRGPKDASALGIATVYQDLALCDNLDVVANLYLGREMVHFPRSLDEEAMERRALAVLATLDVRLPNVRAPIAALSGGQRQSVAVARAILPMEGAAPRGLAKVVLLDEPTAALGVAQTRQVLDLIMRLRSQGLSVVVISHNLGDVFQVADRVVVLRLGRVAGNLAIRTTTTEEVVARITGAAGAEVADTRVAG
jgi:D-xylose transport system ATP-binding protein